MARVTHIKPKNMSKSEAVQKAHDHLLKHYKELGMTHPPCSVPGCKGYYPKEEKKSMLEDWQAFAAWREAYLTRKYPNASVSSDRGVKHGQKPEEKAQASPFEDSRLDLEV
jgi:hypothetical protein